MSLLSLLLLFWTYIITCEFFIVAHVYSYMLSCTDLNEGMFSNRCLSSSVTLELLRPCSHHTFGTGTVPERNRAPVFTPVPLRPVVPERADHLAM